MQNNNWIEQYIYKLKINGVITCNQDTGLISRIIIMNRYYLQLLKIVMKE